MNNSALGGTWDELQKEIFTEEEDSESQQVETILKILVPLGKTLAIVPLKDNK